MSEIKTIARTATRKIADIKAQNLKCMAYDLRHDFIAYETDASWAWQSLAEGRAKLSADARGGYTIRLHSNCWFRLVAR